MAKSTVVKQKDSKPSKSSAVKLDVVVGSLEETLPRSTDRASAKHSMITCRNAYCEI
jgi:hypothetical protein